MPKKLATRSHTSSQVTEAILTLVGQIPATEMRESQTPDQTARQIANAATSKAALISGGLALPPGPLGWLTLLPDLIAIWKLQAQMVSDIAGVYGRSATLTREEMLFCLFRHAAAQAVRDLTVRLGGRVVVQRGSLRALQKAAAAVGVKVTQRAIGSAAARWIPIIGAIGVGAYAYYDTAQVARTTMTVFRDPRRLADLSLVVAKHGR